MKRFAKAAVSGIMCLAMVMGSMQSFEAEAANKQVIVTSKIGVNLRKDSDINSERLAIIDTGTVLTVTDEEYGWGKVSYHGFTGYVALYHTSPYGSGSGSSASSSSSSYTARVASSSGAYYRNAPGLNSTRLGLIPNGTALTINGVDRYGWAETVYGGKTVYIAEYLLSSVNNSVSSSAPVTGDSLYKEEVTDLDFYASYNYAMKYWNKRNSSFKYYVNNNCANYVSQILLAGGLDTDDKFCNGSPAFVNVRSFTRYFKSNYGIVYKTNPEMSSIKAGDVIFTDNSTHVMFVMSVKNGEVICNGNTNDRCLYSVPENAINAVLKTSTL
ncbi:MAG: SH3 domain-containing protein, partial [Oscillospiraceae bacterium]|nr:SH3 domain-containing protein [Oscillospiraceae bacterium]